MSEFRFYGTRQVYRADRTGGRGSKSQSLSIAFRQVIFGQVIQMKKNVKVQQEFIAFIQFLLFLFFLPLVIFLFD